METRSTKIGVSLADGAYRVIVETHTRQYGLVRETVKSFPRADGYKRRNAEDFAFGLGAGLRLARHRVEPGVYVW